MRQIMTGSGVMTEGGLCLDQGGGGCHSASSQPAILSVDFDTCVYYLYVMPSQNEVLATYERISEEVRIALDLVAIKFWGYRQDHNSYQFVDTTLWRGYFIPDGGMNDRGIKEMMDEALAYRARSPAKPALR